MAFSWQTGECGDVDGAEHWITAFRILFAIRWTFSVCIFCVFVCQCNAINEFNKWQRNANIQFGNGLVDAGTVIVVVCVAFSCVFIVIYTFNINHCHYCYQSIWMDEWNVDSKLQHRWSDDEWGGGRRVCDRATHIKYSIWTEIDRPIGCRTAQVVCPVCQSMCHRYHYRLSVGQKWTS